MLLDLKHNKEDRDSFFVCLNKIKFNLLWVNIGEGLPCKKFVIFFLLILTKHFDLWFNTQKQLF